MANNMQPNSKECWEIYKGKNDTYDTDYQTAMLAVMGMFNLFAVIVFIMLLFGAITPVTFILLGIMALIPIFGIVSKLIFKDKSLWMPITCTRFLYMIVWPILWFMTGGFYGLGPAWFVFGAVYISFTSNNPKEIHRHLYYLEGVIIFLLTIFYPHVGMAPQGPKAGFLIGIITFLVGGYVTEVADAKQRVLLNAQEHNTALQEETIAQNEELMTMNEELAVLSERLGEEKIRADEANQAKGNFLARMSHEIRTPINAVLGLDTMILRESEESHIRKYARDIQSSGRTLLALVNDILDFSKIESGKMDLINNPYDMASVVNDVVNIARPRALEKNLAFIVDVDGNVPSGLWGDDVRLTQIIVNLLINAVKYTKEGRVQLSINSTLDGEDALVHISVRDTGIGIKEEDFAKLSERFVRIEEERNRNIEGTGLGINIVISLLDLMGSKLEVESVYGVGSNFHFTVRQKITNMEPVGDLSERLKCFDTDDAYAVSFCIPSCRLLVVDDNAMNRNVFIQLLKEMRCTIDEAESGMQCLELIKNTKYDIIFMDHMMPEMDGIETMKKMKSSADHLNADTPVVILTANAINGAREEYLAAGFDEYLTKPIDVDRLENLIGSIIPDELKLEADSLPSVKTKDVTDNEENPVKDWPVLDGVDFENAFRKLRNTDLLKTSIEGFSEMAEADLSTLNEMYADLQGVTSNQQEKNQQTVEEAFKAFRIKVHSMKSNAATIGAYHVAGLAKYMEYAARDNEFDTIVHLMPVFAKEWMALKSKIDEAFRLTDDNSVEDSQSAWDVSMKDIAVPVASEKALHKKSVLAIDDNTLVLRNIKGIIGKEYEVSLVSSGAKALETLEKKTYDMILLDYEMPEMSGLEVLEAIRKDSQFSALPVVLLTGTEGLHPEENEYRPDGYLVKPIDADALIQTVKKMLEN